jgi:hypothetical protein
MEHRKAKRKAIHGEIEGGIISVDLAELCDLSVRGVRFKCSKDLPRRSRHTIAIRHSHVVLHLQGTVVRSRALKGDEEDLYEVAMSFDRFPPEKEDILKGFFLHL